METRLCNKCGQIKPISSFPRRYGRSTHLRQHTCGMCKKRAYIANHPEYKKNEDYRRRARATGVSVEEYLARRESRLKRKAKIKVRKCRPRRCPVLIANPKHDLSQRTIDAERSRDYYHRNIHKARAKVQRWKRNNPAKRSAQHYRERVRWATVPQDLTEQQWSAIKAAYGYRCAYCRRHRRLTQDHVIPVSKGGQHTASNIVPACQSCNSSKGARLPRVTYQPHLII